MARGSSERNCELCGSEFKVFNAWLRNGNAGKFCSRSCAARVRPRPKQILSGVCAYCGASFERALNRRGKMMYCSIKCGTTASTPKKMNHPRWNGGSSDRSFSTRIAIREVSKGVTQCHDCHGPGPFDGHHVKSYSGHPELRNDPSNIVMLCIACHAKRHPEMKNFILSRSVM